MRGKLPAYVSQDRHGLYHFRARIPKKFRLHFNGKAEIKRSLGTDSYREAVKLARSLRAQMDQRMAELEKGVFKARVLVLEGKKRITLPDGTEETVTARIERDEPATEAQKNEHKDFVLRQLDREAAFKLDQARQEALHRAQLTQPGPTRTTPAPQPSRRQKLANVDKKLSELFEAFAQHKRNNGWKNPESHAPDQARQRFNILLQIIGDRPCADLTPLDAAKIFDTLPKVPKNPNRGERAKYSFDEKLKLDAKEHPKISRTTQSKCWELFREVIKFGCAKQRQYLDEDITEGLELRVSKKEAAQNSHDHFTDEELQRIFNGHVYQPEKLKRTEGHDYHFWIPLLAAYTGARINELCQLLTADVKQSKEGIWYLDILDDEESEKDIKTGAARLPIPIHQKLIDLGFLDYVGKRQSDKNCERLFSSGLTYAAKGKWGKNASRWFNGDSECKGYKHSCGFDNNTGKVFHSFRKSFATRLLNRGVPIDKLALLIGHEQEFRTTFDHYIKEVDFHMLKEHVDKLEYDLDLSHVRYLEFLSKYHR